MKKIKFLVIFALIAILSIAIINSCDNRVFEPTEETPPDEFYNLTIWAVPDTIYADDDNATYATIFVLVKDSDNFIVNEQQVNFGTNIGNIIAFDITDSTGIASVEFWDNGLPGVASIVASTNYIEINADEEEITHTITTQMEVAIIIQPELPSTDVNSIGFDVSGQVDIQVAGTGGQESYEFNVSLYDASSNLVEEPRTVYFQFVNAPIGTNIDNQVYWPSSDSVTVVSSGGHASVPINSGSASGTASLKVFTYNAAGDTISSTKSNIVVHAGPPNSVDISVGGHDSGVDVGAGSWQIETLAMLNDAYGNPVDYGTTVFFSLPDDPSWASIVADAYVGNENINGDSLEGLAYTYLIYEGSHTNDSLIIQVEVSGNQPGQTFVDQETVFMPIQQPTIDIVAIPNHIDWTIYNNPSDWRDHTVELSPTVTITVKDAQNNPIHGQEVIFTSERGIPVLESQLDMLPTHPNFTPDHIGITDIDGEILKYYRFYKYECPPPVPSPPGMIAIQITASILGTQVSNQITVTLFRYVD